MTKASTIAIHGTTCTIPDANGTDCRQITPIRYSLVHRCEVSVDIIFFGEFATRLHPHRFVVLKKRVGNGGDTNHDSPYDMAKDAEKNKEIEA